MRTAGRRRLDGRLLRPTSFDNECDSEALITVGFFSPILAVDWAYVDTGSIIDVAPVDFWDFHACHDTYGTRREQAEALGMIGSEAKPARRNCRRLPVSVVLGEALYD